MNSTAELIIWVVLSPIALFFCITCIIIVAHYSPYYHGTDVVLFSLLTALTCRVAFVILIPAILGLAEFSWSLHLCNFYVWIFVTLHLAEIFSFLAASIHWMTIPRFRTGKQIYTSAKYMRIVIFLIWFAAIIVGLVPVIEWSSNFKNNGDCRFLPFNQGEGFSVFFIVINLVTLIMALICTIDTMVLFKHMKQVATDKYQAGRFYLPSSASVAKTASQTVHAKYNELTFSTDLCRLVILLIIGAYLLNHIPLTVIEYIQIVSSPDDEFLENILLWLMLFEALILPHCLWCSKRYRHGIDYIWKVYFKRDISAKEEDPSACTLQSYTRKIRDVDGKTVRVTTKVNGRGTILSDKHLYRNGEIPNGISVVVEDATLERNTRTDTVPITDLDDGMVASNNYSPSVVNETLVKSKSSRHNSDPVSPSSSYLSTPQREVDLQRSASSSSRKSWKEQMRRKHLPPIFVNEAFENEATSATHVDVNESHYYVSSDYHPDYLMNSLPRSVHSVKAMESESSGASNQYNDDDIDRILELEKGSLSSEQCLVMDISDDKSEINEQVEIELREREMRQTAADLSKIFREDSRTPTPGNKSPSSSANSDTLSNASENSVTLQPYNEARRPPWMDMDEETTSFQSPVKTRSEPNVDRGFEEALALNYTSSMAGYSTMGLAFESIKEEPENESEPNSPQNSRSPFKTQAVSTRSSSPSQASSDNPFDSVPMNLSSKHNHNQTNQETSHLTNGYGESVTSFQKETYGHFRESPPLTNGYDDFVTNFHSPSHEVMRSKPSLDSQTSQMSASSEEVANINKQALTKQGRIEGKLNMNEATAYF